MRIAFGLVFALILPVAAKEPPAPAESPLSIWWNGPGLTGNWFGAREALKDAGLSFSGKYYGAFFGVISSETGSRGFWDQGIEFGAEQNFGRLLGLAELEGVRGFAQFRYRDSQRSADPNEFVQANPMFNPSNWMSGTQFRILAFGLEISSADLLPVKDLIVLRGGWLQPQREFIDQPLSKLFLNNAVNSAKGVGGDIPFSSSYSTWGGTLQLRPVDWHYVKGGLFMTFPQSTASGNHGLAFEGFAQDPSQNGLMGIVEAGVTPEFGTSRLPGKYAVGAYYYGATKNSFNGTPRYGQYGFYFQADQMLFRESTPADADGKSFKQPVTVAAVTLSSQGLNWFNLVTFEPAYNNPFTFYFQSGFVYTGLVPGRDADQAMISIASASYSTANIDALQEAGNVNQPNYTLFLEGGYRFAINRWAFVQPFAQYVVRPNGTAAVQNAAILGVATGVTF